MISSYTDLVAELEAWINTPEAIQAIPTFVAMAEAQLNRRLSCRQMTVLQTLTVSGETYSLPCDFAGVKSFRLNTNPVRALEFRNAEEFDDVFLDAGVVPGMPRYYTISGDRFYFSPTPDGDYSARLRYLQRIPALQENGTNWLLEAHPDAYLYGALAQTAPYLKDDARLPMWVGLFDQIIRDINLDSSRQNTAARPAARVKRIG